MDYSNSIRFRFMRLINRMFFCVHYSKTIALQFFIARIILPQPLGKAIVPTNERVLLKLDIHADAGSQLKGSIDRNLYYLGVYEIATLNAIRRFLQPDGNLLDVGSHNGSVALFASKIASKGSVIAFEPVAELFQLLQENKQLNHANNLKLVNMALGAKEGNVSINVNHNNRGSSSIHNTGHEIYAEKEQVVVDTLDNQVAQAGLLRVNIIKIDVEGFELEVLNGAKETLQRFKPLLIIEHDPKNDDVDAPYNFISSLNMYDVYIPKNGRHIKGPLLKVESYQAIPQSFVTNLICIVRESSAGSSVTR